MNTTKPVLFLMTNKSQLSLKGGQSHPTGFYAAEFAEPHQAITKAGFQVEVATEDGSRPPLDQVSIDPNNVGSSRAAELQDMLKMAPELDRAIPFSEVDISRYSAVVVPGGHAPMESMPCSKEVGRILTQAKSSQLVIGALCHGPAALLAAQNNGDWIFEGEQMTSFSFLEEQNVPAVAGKMKWELEPELTEHGGHFSKSAATRPFEAYVIQDGNLVTGENPESAPQFATKLVDLLTDKAQSQESSVAFGVHRDVDASVDEVRQILGKFDALPWHPGLAKGTVDGNTRVLTAKGENALVFTEELRELSENHVTYQMTEGLPFQPLSTLSFKSNDQGGTRIDWTADFDTQDHPEEEVQGVVAGVTAFYEAGLDALKERFAKGS